MTLKEIQLRSIDIEDQNNRMAGLIVAFVCGFSTLGIGILTWATLCS